MAKQTTVVLADGRRVKYSLVKRGSDPFWIARFRLDPTRKGYLERSTRHASLEAAHDAAVDVIAAAANEQPRPQLLTWDVATAKMADAMRAQNLRETTISDYSQTLNVLRKVFPRSIGPSDITDTETRKFKAERMASGVSPVTVASNLRKLSAVWSWYEEVGVTTQNPWEEVEAPKTDTKTKRVITKQEEEGFVAWLVQQYPTWNLPKLFFVVKARIGCRIKELASLEKHQLRDGRIWFLGNKTKGRKDRGCLLPKSVYEELVALPGTRYVWESYTDGLKAIYLNKGGRYKRYARELKEFTPEKLVHWMQRAVTDYCDLMEKQTPGFRRFTAHNFRGTAMSRAKDLGITYEEASIAFDCHIETMKQYYVDFDEQRVSDSVFSKLQQ